MQHYAKIYQQEIRPSQRKKWSPPGKGSPFPDRPISNKRKIFSRKIFFSKKQLKQFSKKNEFSPPKFDVNP